jgi:hypothetical protein
VIILTFNLLAGTIAFITARLQFVRTLPALGIRAALQPNMLLQSLRQLWLMVLLRGVGYPGIPGGFVLPGASGDLLAVLLALAALYALVKGLARVGI